MATIADELLNDFGVSGDENDEEQLDSTYLDNYADQNGDGKGALGEGQYAGMELDGDEEEPDDDVEGHVNLKAEVEEDAEETKARIEKMELHNVSDVRSVAGLMKQLEPLLEVSLPMPSTEIHIYEASSLNFLNTALTIRSVYRKSTITDLFRLAKKRETSATSKTTRSTSF